MPITTITIDMTGDPVPVAGAGECTITCSALALWFVAPEGPTAPVAPSDLHRTSAYDNESLRVPNNSNLWVSARNGTKLAVSREAPPVLT